MMATMRPPTFTCCSTASGSTGSEPENTITSNGAPAIDIRALDFEYIEGQRVLHQLSLEIPQGAFFGIVGHTGSGKSTLLSLLLRYYPAPHGSILMNGVPLDEICNDEFRADVGLVPQDPFLLAASARENIDIGRVRVTDDVWKVGISRY